MILGTLDTEYGEVYVVDEYTSHMRLEISDSGLKILQSVMTIFEGAKVEGFNTRRKSTTVSSSRAASARGARKMGAAKEKTVARERTLHCHECSRLATAWTVSGLAKDKEIYNQHYAKHND